jgi:hypothetical protein
VGTEEGGAVGCTVEGTEGCTLDGTGRVCATAGPEARRRSRRQESSGVFTSVQSK